MSLVGDDLSPTVSRVLELARAHLGMDVAWISEFAGDQQVFRALSGDVERFGIGLDEGAPAVGSYCVRVLDGRLPALIPDAAADGRTAGLQVTEDLGIGAYAGVPVRSHDGSVSGMLCCINRAATDTLDPGAVQVLEMLAKIVAEDRAAQAEQARRGSDERDRVRRFLDDPDALAPVFQPIVELASGRLVGYESLTRFADGTPPDVAFSLAARVGLGAELEQVAAARALAQIRRAGGTASAWVNVSPAALRSARLRSTLLDFDPARLVVEITEHAVVDSYETLAEDLAPLRECGVRIAVDDAGAGFASMQHVLRLRPDIIKLDGGLIRGIAGDPVRQALTSSLVSFGRSIGSQILAEAIETPSELDTLHRLGVELAQGYLLARPGALPGPVSFPTATRRRPPSDSLTQIAAALSDAPDLESLVRPLLDAVLDLTEMDTAYLTVLEDDGSLEHRYVRNAGPIQLPEGLVLPWEDSLCHRCAELGIVWTDRALIDLPGVPLAEQAGLQTYLSVPLTDADGSLLGTLCAGSTRSLFVPDHVVAQVRLCAHLVATRLAAAPSAGAAEVSSPLVAASEGPPAF